MAVTLAFYWTLYNVLFLFIHFLNFYGMMLFSTDELTQFTKDAHAFHLQRRKNIEASGIGGTEEKRAQERFALVHIMPLGNEDPYRVDFTDDPVKQFLEAELSKTSAFTSWASHSYNHYGRRLYGKGRYIQYHRNAVVELYDDRFFYDQKVLRSKDLFAWVIENLTASMKLWELVGLGGAQGIVSCSIVLEDKKNIEVDFNSSPNKPAKFPKTVTYPPLRFDKMTSRADMAAELKPLLDTFAQTCNRLSYPKDLYEESYWNNMIR